MNKNSIICEQFIKNITGEDFYISTEMFYSYILIKTYILHSLKNPPFNNYAL